VQVLPVSERLSPKKKTSEKSADSAPPARHNAAATAPMLRTILTDPSPAHRARARAATAL
jgi:hypothetical protein